jgi:glycosyltransferase involved in cell wall biosynthesis
MRILEIASGNFFSTSGGGQVYVKNIVDEMIHMQCDLYVISNVASSEGVHKRDYNGIALYEINSASHLKEVILTVKPDIIHAHSLKDLACRYGKELGIPVIVTAHHGGILCPAGTRLNCKDEICHTVVNHKECLPCVLRNTRTGLWWYPIMRLLPQKSYVRLGEMLRKLPFIYFVTPIGLAAIQIKGKHAQWDEIAEKCTVMVAPCDEIATAMIQNGLDKSKVVVIPHGIPLPATRPEYPEVIDGKVKFYYVGRICNVKGIHTLLEAFHSVKNEKIELHLIGDDSGKYPKRLQRKYANDSRIVWHGKIPPEEVFYATAKYHVSSSSAFLEAFGLNIAESLAMGKPVLATRSGGGEMQIRDGENGWLVPTNDANALAEKIEYISSHPEILPAMSKRCHAESIHDHCEKLLTLYNELISSSQKCII